MRKKNALREHWVALPAEDGTLPTTYLPLAAFIQTISHDANEGNNDEAFYDGDGTPETSVDSVRDVYSFSGYRDRDNEGQNLIAGLYYKTGEGRKIYFKVIEPDKVKTTKIGRATVANIVLDGGDASSWETFSCDISFDMVPTITEGSPASPSSMAVSTPISNKNKDKGEA